MTRIAMWSGPRNLSTALMRSWDSRSDTFVTDEPFYAAYLLRVEVDHPGRDEVIASQENDWKKVASWLTGPIPDGKSIWYQKQMAHHLLAGMEGEWLDGLTHAFLIRDPASVVASFTRVVDAEITPRDLGLPQQVAIFERMKRRYGTVPPVVDSADLLRDPPGVLRRLCDALEVPWDESMLSWEPGRRATDGVWAKHWYASVEKSTGFGPPRDDEPRLDERQEAIREACRPYYETLAAHRL